MRIARTVMGAWVAAAMLAACGGRSQPATATSSEATSAGTGGSGNGSGSTGGSDGGGGSTSSSGTGGQVDVLAQLEAIPGVVGVDEQPSEHGGYRFFLIYFDQPVDHDDPAGPHFTQRLTLQHLDASAPLVLASTGYDLFLPYQIMEEPTLLLSANQLAIEHRYFTPSRPSPADWSLLNVAQAAADHHAIAQAFHPLYTAKWISTGASKGGMTSMYHRRFYPGDVDGTVAYVAPHSAGLDDPRYVDFLNSVGTEACRARLVEFEREVLLRRAAMTARMEDQAAQSGLGYGLLGVDAAFEGAVLSFSFSFWQYQDASLCDAIPDPSASDDEIWGFFDPVGMTFFSTDPYVLEFEPYYWQAYSQLGTPGSDDAPLADLLTVDFSAIDDLPSIDVDPVFDPAAMQDVSSWLASQGSRILFIYGQNDPWTAAAFDPSGAEESYKLVVPGGNHGSQIWGLSPDDQKTALDALEAWTGVKLPRKLVPRRRLPMEPPPRRFLGRRMP